CPLPPCGWAPGADTPAEPGAPVIAVELSPDASRAVGSSTRLSKPVNGPAASGAVRGAPPADTSSRSAGSASEVPGALQPHGAERGLAGAAPPSLSTLPVDSTPGEG